MLVNVHVFTLPFMPSCASLASSELSYFTKPKQRDFPVSLSLITSTILREKKNFLKKKKCITFLKNIYYEIKNRRRFTFFDGSIFAEGRGQRVLVRLEAQAPDEQFTLVRHPVAGKSKTNATISCQKKQHKKNDLRKSRPLRSARAELK